MSWNIEITSEFERWWNSLSTSEQVDVDAHIHLIEQYGPVLSRPYCDTIKQSKHANMKELRIQHKGKPYRILYAFDPRRTAILLLGGVKTGDDRWYDKYVPLADQLFDAHLNEIQE